MNLAMFAALGMTDIHEMNALKLVLVTVINGVATATLSFTGAIVWPQALVMLAGAVLGGIPWRTSRKNCHTVWCGASSFSLDSG